MIRITARFVDVATGAVLRNVKIDGALGEIFALQDRIVFELTQGLQLKLEAVGHQSDPAAGNAIGRSLRAVLSRRADAADGDA